MIDIVHPHCKIEGCATLASFNMPGESRGEYCSQHKLVCHAVLHHCVHPLRDVHFALPFQASPAHAQAAHYSCRLAFKVFRALDRGQMRLPAGGHGECEAPQMRRGRLQHEAGLQLEGRGEGRLLQQAQGEGHGQCRQEGRPSRYASPLEGPHQLLPCESQQRSQLPLLQPLEPAAGHTIPVSMCSKASSGPRNCLALCDSSQL